MEDWLKGSWFSFILCVATGEKRGYMRQKKHCSAIFRETFHHGEMKKNDSRIVMFQTSTSTGMKSDSTKCQWNDLF